MHTDGPSRDRLLLRRRTNYASHTLDAVGGGTRMHRAAVLRQRHARADRCGGDAWL